MAKVRIRPERALPIVGRLTWWSTFCSFLINCDVQTCENRATDAFPKNVGPPWESLGFIRGLKRESSCRQPFLSLWVGAEVALSLDSPVSRLHEITDVLNVPFISLVWLNLPKEKCAALPGRPDPINHELTVTFSWFSFLLFNTKLSQKILLTSFISLDGFVQGVLC